MSNNYQVFKTDEFLKKLSKLPALHNAFIQKKLKGYVYPQLKKEPYFGKNIKKLKDYHPETWRYKIGKFRLFYSVDQIDKTIFILTIDFRKNSYR